MKYYYEPKTKVLHKLTDNKMKPFKREWVPKPNSTQELRAAYVCQLVSEGKSLIDICNLEWAPNNVLFRRWIESDTEIATWFKDAEKYRLDSLKEMLVAEPLN